MVILGGQCKTEVYVAVEATEDQKSITNAGEDPLAAGTSSTGEENKEDSLAFA